MERGAIGTAAPKAATLAMLCGALAAFCVLLPWYSAYAPDGRPDLERRQVLNGSGFAPHVHGEIIFVLALVAAGASALLRGDVRRRVRPSARALAVSATVTFGLTSLLTTIDVARATDVPDGMAAERYMGIWYVLLAALAGTGFSVRVLLGTPRPPSALPATAGPWAAAAPVRPRTRPAAGPAVAAARRRAPEETPEDDPVAVAYERLRGGIPEDRVVRELVEMGLPADRARRLVEGALRTRKARRRAGMGEIVAGAVILVAAALLLWHEVRASEHTGYLIVWIGPPVLGLGLLIDGLRRVGRWEW